MQGTSILETSILGWAYMNANGLIYQIVQQIDLMKLRLSCTFIPATHSLLT